MTEETTSKKEKNNVQLMARGNKQLQIALSRNSADTAIPTFGPSQISTNMSVCGRIFISFAYSLIIIY